MTEPGPINRARRYKVLILLIGLGVALFVGWRIVDARAARSFADAIKHSDNLLLLEGLPHQMFERVALQQELKSKPTIQLQDYSFYKDPIHASDEDVKKLRELLGNSATFETFSGEKRCGGFHPDWAIELQVDGKRHLALLCFGCGEAKVGSDGNVTRYDLKDATEDDLEKLLTTYRKNRPVRED